MVKPLQLSIDPSITASPMRQKKAAREAQKSEQFSPAVMINLSGKLRVEGLFDGPGKAASGTLIPALATLRNNASDILNIKEKLAKAPINIPVDSLKDELNEKSAEISTIIQKGSFDKLAKGVLSAVEAIRQGSAGNTLIDSTRELSAALGAGFTKRLKLGDTTTLESIGQKLAYLASPHTLESLNDGTETLNNIARNSKELLNLLEVKVSIDDVIEDPSSEIDANLVLENTILQVAKDIAESIANLNNDGNFTLIHKLDPERSKGLLL